MRKKVLLSFLKKRKFKFWPVITTTNKALVIILWYSEWINGYDKNLAHVDLLSLALKIRWFEPFSFFICWINNDEQVNLSFHNCTNFNHVNFYDVMYPISLLSLCSQYTCNVGGDKVNSSKIWINSLISRINSALENCSSSKRTEAKASLGGKGNHSKRLFWDTDLYQHNFA